MFSPSLSSIQPQPLTAPDSQRAQDAADQAANERRRARGLASTILSLPSTSDDGSVGRKMLLGS